MRRGSNMEIVDPINIQIQEQQQQRRNQRPFNFNMDCNLSHRQERALKITAIVICVLCIFVLFPVLLSQSFVVVENDEVAILYHKVSREIGSSIKEQGRHFVSVGTSAIKYKRTVQVLDMSGDNSPQCLTSDGIEIDLDLRIQFQYQKDRLFDILNDYGDSDAVFSYINSLARESVRNIVSNFSTDDMYYNRTLVQDSILTQLKFDFNRYNAYTDVSLVQLISITLPIAYSSAITAIQSATQEISVAQNERQESLIRANTLLDIEKRNYDIKLLQANAQASAIRAQNDELVNVTRTLWTQRTNTYTQIMSGMSLSSDVFVDTYVRSLVMKESQQAIVKL